MALVGATTPWVLFAGFLLFGRLGLPVFLQRAAATLLTLELVVLLAYSYAAEDCRPAPPCSVSTEALRALASQDLPALAALLYVLAAGTGLRRLGLTTRSR